MENKIKSRLNRKGNAVEFKDDDYETPKEILTDLLPFLEKDKIIYDPFYCNGIVIGEWEKLGYKWAKNCFHLSYGMVDLPSGKMKSREGTVVDADNLIEEMIETSTSTSAFLS